jgi:uncharacterized delta-60 repeat protein
MRVLNLALSALLLMGWVGVAQAQSPLWTQKLNGAGNRFDGGNAVALDSSGNVYVTGGSTGALSTGYDAVTAKYSATGVLQWAQRFNGAANGTDQGNAIALDASGNVYVAGFTATSRTGLDLLVLKYSTAGTLLWRQTYNGFANRDDVARVLRVDSGGSIYLTGYSQGNGVGQNFDALSLKYNPNGTLLWAQRYGGSGNDEAFGLALDSSNNVYVTGYSFGNTSTDNDLIVLKYNQAGLALWAWRYNGTGSRQDYGWGIVVDSSGNAYVTGSTYSSSAAGFDLLVLKYNANGVFQWERKWNGLGSKNDIGLGIALDSSSNAYVTGTTYVSSTAGNNILTLKYNSSGVLQWSQAYGGSAGGYDEGRVVGADTAGNVTVMGFSTETGVGTDILTVRYAASNGAVRWTRRYDTARGNDYGNAMVVNAAGTVYVTGTTYVGTTTQDDLVLFKY